MRPKKVTAGQWGKKRPTGFVRPPRISRRRRAKIQGQIAQAMLTAQIREGLKSPDDGPRITEI